MTHPIWPIETREGAAESTPQTINFGSDAPHHATNLGVDVTAVMHDYWVAIAHSGVPDVGLIGKWESLGAAGVACELQWEHEGARYNLRYCHGHEHYGARWPHAVGGSVYVGERIGEVGVTGNINPPGPAGAHLHLAAAVGCEPGGLLESGQRVKADDLLAEIIASYEGEEPLTPEQERLIAIGVRAEEHLQTCIDVTSGWGNKLLYPGIPKRPEEKQAGRELVDVSKSLTYVLTGESP